MRETTTATTKFLSNIIRMRTRRGKGRVRIKIRKKRMRIVIRQCNSLINGRFRAQN